MTRLRVLILALVLFLTLFLGQGLGRFYLGNITREVPEETRRRNISLTARGGSSALDLRQKKKVLRLKQVEYYTLLMATTDEREEALQIGEELGQKGFPVIVTGEGPCEVLLGLVNQEENLVGLAKRIKVGEKEAEISKDYLNKVAFKFVVEDTLAAEEIAPFLGKVSLCLEKGLFLYPGTVVEDVVLLRPKFSLLADSLAEVALEGQRISETSEEEMSKALKRLSRLCSQWGESLRQVEKEWTDLAYLKSQQQGLALLEGYHRLLQTTN